MCRICRHQDNFVLLRNSSSCFHAVWLKFCKSSNIACVWNNDYHKKTILQGLCFHTMAVQEDMKLVSPHISYVHHPVVLRVSAAHEMSRICEENRICWNGWSLVIIRFSSCSCGSVRFHWKLLFNWLSFVWTKEHISLQKYRKQSGHSTFQPHLCSIFWKWFNNTNKQTTPTFPALFSVMWTLLCWKWLKTCIYLLSKGLGLKIICLWHPTLKQQNYFARKESMQWHCGKSTVTLQQKLANLEVEPLPTKASEKWLQVRKTLKQKQIWSWTKYLVCLNTAIPQCHIVAVLLALYLDISILLVDLDVVFLQQPFPHLHCTDCDFIFQMNRPRIKELNSGCVLTVFVFPCLWSFVQYSFPCFRVLYGSSNLKC